MSPWRLTIVHAVADTTLVPTYTDPMELSQATQGLYMRDITSTMTTNWGIGTVTASPKVPDC